MANEMKQNIVIDMLQWSLIAVIIGGAAILNQVYAQTPLIFRVLGIAACGAFCLFLAYRTSVGKRAWNFFTESKQEIRKVVWPTRQETLQTTLMVFVMVVVMGILLWTFDAVCLRIIAWLTGYGA